MDSSNESSSSEEEGLLKKALDVELPKNFDPTRAPTTGEEYLHHVIYERKKHAKWLTVDVDTSKFKNNEQSIQIHMNKPIRKAPPHLLPTQVWQQEQVEDFLKLRRFIAWKTKKEPEKDLVHESAWKNVIFNETPTFSQLTALKQCAKMKLLNFICEYLKTPCETNNFNCNFGIWVYSVLATLEFPLSPSDCHQLRELAKEIALLRLHLNGEAEKECKCLNLCICLIAKVFGQTDLADV